MDQFIVQILGFAKRMWQYRWAGLLVSWVVGVVGAVVVFVLPDRYEASARIYVDTQSILKPLMAGLTVQPNVEQQVTILSRTLISRPNVEKLIRMADLDLTNKQWAPLIMLMRCRCHTAAELARELEVDTGAMTRMLDRLEGKGFIRREPSAEDRRVFKLALTADGEQVSQRVPEILSASFNRHLAGFTIEELDQLMAMLRRMLANGVGPTGDDDTGSAGPTHA